MILHLEIKPTDNKPYISNQRALLRCDAGVGRDKSHLITTPRTDKFISYDLVLINNAHKTIIVKIIIMKKMSACN